MKRFYLSPDVLLRWLEFPAVYHVRKDELYELDETAFEFLQQCINQQGCYTQDMEFIQYCLQEDILCTEAQKPRKQKIKKSPEPSLRYLELLITDRCNLRCKHCYINDATTSDLPLETIVKILEEFHEIQGLRLLISGGEPLLHRQFMQLNEFLRDYPLRKVLLTNGMLLNSELLRELNVDEIQFSIDGIEESHEMIRGQGTFQKTIKNLKEAIKEGFDVSVSTMIHKGNVNQFQEMEKFFISLGVKEWTVDVPCNVGRMALNPALCLPPEQAGQYLRYGFGGGIHGGTEGYGCGTHLMAVMPDGSVAKCAFYWSTPVGHVSEGLSACWAKLNPVSLKGTECESCEHLNECRGGCRYRAELCAGPSGPDPYKCYAFGVRKG